MKFKEWLGWKNNWPIYGLLFLFIPAFWWFAAWSGGTVLKWWRTLEGRLADPVFFEWEEFIALHSLNNEWPGRCGFYLIILTGTVFLLLRLARVIRTDARALLIIMGFTGVLLFFSVCMCQSKEKTNRKFCQWNLHDFQKAYIPFLKEHGRYPATLLTKDFPEEETLRHKLQENCKRFGNYLYPGAERTLSGERFIVIEDAPRTHAGDLRHRLWSDGICDSYYPWKAEGGDK